MKKITSLLLTAVLLCTLLTVFAVPASAENDTTVMKASDTCTLNLKKTKSSYIEFTSPYNQDYTFISNITEDKTHRAILMATLRCGNETIATDYATTGDGNFCISYSFEAGKTYSLEIRLERAESCSADVSLLRELKPNAWVVAFDKCIISKPGTYEMTYLDIFSGETPGSLVIGRNTTVKVKERFSNEGKVEVFGKLDLSTAPMCSLGEIIVDKNGSLVEPDPAKFDYSYNGGGIGSAFSEGNLWIIIAVAVVVLGGIAALVIVKKKKKKKTAVAGEKSEE